jgi:uncharacterized protein (TIGR00730 family)
VIGGERARRRVTVFGGSRVVEGSDEYGAARRLGRLLAERGFALVTGGYQGVMEAVSRGAREGGGHVVGVTVEVITGTAVPNAYLDEQIQTVALLERIDKLVELGDGYVVLPGGAGTLAELAVVWNLAILRALRDKPIAVVGAGWERVLRTLVAELHAVDADLGCLRLVADVDAAAEVMTTSLAPER